LQIAVTLGDTLIGLPLVIVLAGGYAPSRARTAQLHAHVFREAVAYERGAES
jgi:hypothetical protein